MVLTQLKTNRFFSLLVSLSLLASSFAVAATPASAQTTTLAFPTAEGAGRFAEGGRGGAVYIVSNLNDAGAGSLRECVEASGPRTCTFSTGGTIEIDSVLRVKSPNLTIAGQTAPGDGIQIKYRNNLDAAFKIEASDVIVRHLRIRPGPTVKTSDLPNCFVIGADKNVVSDIMVDHVSCSWTTDQAFFLAAGTDVTIQWSAFYEGLSHSTHKSGEHSKGPFFKSCKNVSFHHNFVSDYTDRNPNFNCEGTAHMTNNVFYNAGEYFTMILNANSPKSTSPNIGFFNLNAVGNTYIKGPSTRSTAKATWIVNLPGAPMKLHFKDNTLIGGLTLNESQYDNLITSVPNGTIPQSVTSAATAYDAVLSYAGASPRDAADARASKEIKDRTGKIIDNPSEVGGWPTLSKGTALTDADKDGMSDAWEAKNGLSSSNAADRNSDKDNDGYTNLEEYLNERHVELVPTDAGIAGTPGTSTPAPVPTPTQTPASSKFAAGSKVEATDKVNVRATAGVTAALLGQQVLGSIGTVSNQTPVSADGYVWIYVDFMNSPDGWVTETYFKTYTAPTPAPTPTPLPTTSKYKAGSKVSTTDVVNVRTAAGVSTTLLGTQAKGIVGTVLADTPLSFDGYTWIKVDFASGVDGWVTETYLGVYVVPTPTTPTTPTTPPTPTTPTVPSTPTTTAPSTLFTKDMAVITTKEVSVRSTAAGSKTGGQKNGAKGKIVAGPQSVSGKTWWKVDFATGSDGWVEEVSIKVAPTTPTTPTTPSTPAPTTPSTPTTPTTPTTPPAPTTPTTNDGDTVTTPVVTPAFGLNVSVKTTKAVEVSKAPGGASLGIQTVDATGVITEGPKMQDGKTWWKVDFATGSDGWVAESRLAVTGQVKGASTSDTFSTIQAIKSSLLRLHAALK